MKKYYVNYGSALLFMFVLLAFIVLKKELYLAPNLNIGANLLIYPFTFLIVAIIYDKYNIKVAKDSIYVSFAVLLLFYLLISIINTLDSVTNAALISTSLKEVFTPNYISFLNYNFYYPDIFSLLTYSIIFFITHYIFAIAYEAIEGNTNYFIGFILAFLLSTILDQLLFIPLVNLPYLINATLSYKALIEGMTASFIIMMFSSLIMLIIFLIIKKRN